MVELRSASSHILNPKFCDDRKRHNELFKSYMEKTLLTNGYQVQILRAMLFQDGYGVCQHSEYTDERDRRLMGLRIASLHPKENLIDHNPRQNMLRRFAKASINKYWGYNFTEFIRYHSTEECDDMFTLAEELKAMDNNALNDDLNNLGKG